jgi:hypothetical protein
MLGVAGGALRQERFLPTFFTMRVGVGELLRVNLVGNIAAHCGPDWLPGTQGVEVPFMALQTEERFVLCQQIIGNSAVRIMAGRTALGNRGVLKDKGALVAGVALEAQIVGALFGDQAFRSMRVVAIAAAHLAFFHRVVRGEVGFGLLLLVARVAKLRVLLLESRLAAGMD